MNIHLRDLCLNWISEEEIPFFCCTTACSVSSCLVIVTDEHRILILEYFGRNGLQMTKYCNWLQEIYEDISDAWPPFTLFLCFMLWHFVSYLKTRGLNIVFVWIKIIWKFPTKWTWYMSSTSVEVVKLCDATLRSKEGKIWHSKFCRGKVQNTFWQPN